MNEIICDIEENTFTVDGKIFTIEENATITSSDIKLGVRLDDDVARIAEAHTIAEEVDIKFPTYNVTGRITNVTHEPNCTGVITYIEMVVNKHIDVASYS